MKTKFKFLTLLLTLLLVFTCIPTMKVEAGGLPAAYPVKYDDNKSWLQYMSSHYPATRSQVDGTCVVYSTVAAIEFSNIRHGYESNPTKVDYSEAQIAYWSRHTLPNSSSTGDSLTFRNRSLTYSFSTEEINAALIQGVGPINESVAPQSLIKSFATTKLDDNTAFMSNYQLKRAYNVSASDKNAIKNAIYNDGAVQATLYSDITDKNLYVTEADIRNRHNGSLSGVTMHCVAIVGWDDNFSKDKFITPNGSKPKSNGAWLVRNSWNTTTCYDFSSYSWISYESYFVGPFNAYEFTKKTNTDSYSYNNSAFYTIGIDNIGLTSTKFANVFTANSNETIKFINFSVNKATGTSYKVKIYSNLTNINNPESGQLRCATSGTVTDQHINLAINDVYISKGKTFSIVIETSAGTSVSIEHYTDSRSGPVLDYNYTPNAGANQSYVYTNNWTDIGKQYGRNLIITVGTNRSSGLVQVNNRWVYWNGGSIDTSKTGFVDYNGGKFYVKNGYLDTSANGIVKDPNSNTKYFVASGQVCTTTSGLAMYNGKWYYLNKGVYDTSFTGITSYNGAQFYVVRGDLATYYTGKVTYNGRTYNVVSGQVY